MGYTPHVLVVGGGATGTAVARDLAIRGLEVTLLDRGPLAGGATGRSHGRLHSGARFAVRAPDVAARCHTENERLRAIAAHCVDETGGILAALPGDGDEIERTRTACEEVGITVEGFDADGVQKLEPRLSSDVDRGLFVPDAAIDPFQLTVATAAAAQEYGASVETHAEVTDVTVEDGAVRGVEVWLKDVDERDDLRVDYVVNAAGPWADRIAAEAGVDVSLHHTTGTRLVVDDRPTEAVVSRLRSGGTRDTLVPFDRRCVLGSTGEGEGGPDAGAGSTAVDDLLSDLSALVPGLAEVRPFRTYRGVRTVVESDPGDVRQTDGGGPPGFRVLDHEQRDGLWGLTTVAGGPLTLSRLAAETVADQVCEKFGIARECLTAEHPLPGSEGEPDAGAVAREFGLDRTVASRTADRLGSRTREVLEGTDPNPVVCACESVTRAEIRDAMVEERGDPTDLDAVRIRTRAGMGECQGGRCCHRIAAELHPSHDRSAVDAALDGFSRSRWSGQREVLWGDRLAAAMETYAFHAATMNRGVDHRDLDLDAFDSGPEWDESREGDGEGSAP